MPDNSGSSVVARAKSDYRFWMALLGALLSAPPIISLIQKSFQVELVPALLEALQFYRRLYYPVIEAAQYVLSLVPWLNFYELIYSGFMSRATYKDLAALSCVSAIALYRVVIRNNVDWERPAGAIVVAVIFAAGYAVFAFTLIPLVSPLVVLRNMTTHDVNSERVEYLASLGMAAVATAAFYIANAVIK
jgi:hypothetical protein